MLQDDIIPSTPFYFINRIASPIQVIDQRKIRLGDGYKAHLFAPHRYKALNCGRKVVRVGKAVPDKKYVNTGAFKCFDRGFAGAKKQNNESETAYQWSILFRQCMGDR